MAHEGDALLLAAMQLVVGEYMVPQEVSSSTRLDFVYLCNSNGFSELEIGQSLSLPPLALTSLLSR